MMNRNRIMYFLLLFCFEFIILIDSIGGDFSSWPRFYEWGESTVPTQQILNNLTFYRDEWEDIKSTEGIDETYSLIFAWDCSPCGDECNAANKFINVVDDKISSVKVAKLNDKEKLKACKESTSPTNISDYKTIDELYEMTIDWVSTCLEAEDPSICKVIELMLHKTFLFPMAVKLSKGAQFIQWDIPCFQPGEKAQEQTVCEYSSSTYEEEKQWSFWITEEMQSFLGWSMIFLILVACSLGYCINWLKKKKSEKIEAWREKEERQRQEKEKQKAAAKAKKKKRKSSKAKHRAHLEKSRRHKLDQQQYASLNQVNDDQSAEELLYDHYDITEEEHKRDLD